MGIRTKIFTPMLIMMAIFLGYVWLIWEPQYLGAEREDYVMHYLIEADLISKGVSSQLAQGNMQAAFEELNRISSEYPLFNEISVIDPNGNSIYKRHGTPLPSDADMEKIKVGLNFREGLGSLNIAVDIQRDLANEKEAIHKPVALLQSVFIITILAIAIFISQWLRKPLCKLSKASTAIANGDFNASLPVVTNDEIGRLASNFSSMRDAVSESQRNLLLEIDERKKAERLLERDVDIQKAIDALMRCAIVESSLEEIIQKSLDIILNLSWLPVTNMAIVFLSDESGDQLNITASRNMPVEIINRCKKVDFGECNCGKVAKTQRTMLNLAENGCPLISDGVKSQGDCITIPMQAGGRMLGVVNIYIDSGAFSGEVERILPLLVETLGVNVDRKLSELRLRRQAKLLEQMQDALIGFDDAYVISMWNTGAQALFGYTADEIKMESAKLLFDIDENESLPIKMDAMTVGGSEAEIAMVKKNGECIRALLSVSRVDGDKNIDAGWLMHVSDVTDMREIENELRLLNENLERRVKEGTKEVLNQKFALDQHSIVVITDKKGNITYVNDKYCQISGFHRNELLGQKNRMLSAEGKNEFISQGLWKTIERGNVWAGELAGQRKDGSEFWVDTTVVPFMDESGYPYQYVSIHTDITDARQFMEEQKERTIRLNRQQDALLILTREGVFDAKNLMISLRALMESAIDALAVDWAGVWLLSNDRSELQDEIVASRTGHISDRIEPIKREDCPEFFNAIENELLIAADDVLEYPSVMGLAKANLSMRGVASVLCLPIRISGKIKGMVMLEHGGAARHWQADEQQFGIVLADMAALIMEQVGRREAESRLAVTAQQLRLANRELDKALIEAQKASSVKSEFLATMSHEVRTPMNGIMGMLEMLKDSQLDDGDRKYVNIAHNSAKMLLDLLNNVLDFSKIEAGNMRLEAMNFSPDKVIEDVASLMRALADAKSVELRVELDKNIPEKIYGDPLRFRQVLANLIGNAIKFTPKGDVLVKSNLIQNENGHEIVRVEIHDTGIGINADDQARIFEAFAQADGTTTRQFGGTGLGLTICRQLVKLMHGDIGVNSVPGKGSVFWFTIPIQSGGSIDRHVAA